MSQLKVNSIIPVSGVPTGGGGGIIQVKQAIKTDTFSTTTNPGSVSAIDIPSLSVAITPTSNSSKILIFCNVGGHVHNSMGGALLIHRSISGGSSGTLSTGLADAGNNRLRSNFTGNLYTTDGGGALDLQLHCMSFILDSPATTNAVTYKAQLQKLANNDLYCINRSESDNDSNDEARTTSQITVMEVSA